jgi:hypothetical protein
MSKNGRDDQDPTYEVGYRKPPRKTRFVKGQSGNPSGRKRKPPDLLSEIIMRAASEPVTVIVNGKRKRMSKFEVGMVGFFSKFATRPTNMDLKIATALYRDSAQALEALANSQQIVEFQFIDGDGMPIEELNKLYKTPKKD